MTGHGLRLSNDGRLTLFRSAPPEDAGRLRRTIESLRASAGAGAVEILQLSDDGERVELVLAFAGRAPAAPMQAQDLAPVAAALAGHLSDLHLRGLAHGAIQSEHVLVDADRRVRLCGFGRAHDALPPEDVYAFGALIRELLDDEDRSVAADALRVQADRCRVDVAVRPTMAAVAASLARVDGRVRAVPAVVTPVVSRRHWQLGITAAVVLGLVILFAVRPHDSRADDHRATARTTTTALPWTATTLEPTRVWPTSLQGDGSTWALGNVDDWTLLGDWNCDGIETPALVQRSTNAVFVVDAWPDVEAPTRYVTTITGVLDVSVERDALSPCDRLVVVTADGESIRVSLSA